MLVTQFSLVPCGLAHCKPIFKLSIGMRCRMCCLMKKGACVSIWALVLLQCSAPCPQCMETASCRHGGCAYSFLFCLVPVLNRKAKWRKEMVLGIVFSEVWKSCCNLQRSDIAVDSVNFSDLWIYRFHKCEAFPQGKLMLVFPLVLLITLGELLSYWCFHWKAFLFLSVSCPQKAGKTFYIRKVSLHFKWP